MISSQHDEMLVGTSVDFKRLKLIRDAEEPPSLIFGACEYRDGVLVHRTHSVTGYDINTGQMRLHMPFPRSCITFMTAYYVPETWYILVAFANQAFVVLRLGEKHVNLHHFRNNLDHVIRNGEVWVSAEGYTFFYVGEQMYRIPL